MFTGPSIVFSRDSMRFARGSLLALVVTVGLASELVTGVSAGRLVPQPDASTRSKEAALKRALFEMREVIDQYYVDNGRYPKNLKTLENEGYLARIPTDPFTRRNDSWRTFPAKQPARRARQPPGIYDVKSGSRRTAVDGTRYSDW